MPIHLEWDDAECRILRLNFDGGWTWDDFYAATRERDRLLNSQPHRVDLLADFSSSGKLPAGSPISSARSVLASPPPNLGMLVIVSNSLFIDVLVNTFQRVFAQLIGLKITVVDSVAAARSEIAAARRHVSGV
ncbi:MAG: hypothetical protein MUE40_15205 [Anaerolineae bacterium]|jgi:hypothetical protein|nr:hypothetical protein [Anaerolineae bacterium]